MQDFELLLMLLPIGMVGDSLEAVFDAAAASAVAIATDGVELLLIPIVGGLSASWEEDISAIFRLEALPVTRKVKQPKDMRCEKG